jgi:transposase
LQLLEARHPGLMQKVDAMFEAFATIKAVEVMILAEYGERMSHSTIWKYKKQSWSPRKKREQVAQAAEAAWQELVCEGRN